MATDLKPPGTSHSPPSYWAHAAWVVFPAALVEWLAVAMFGSHWPLDTGVATGLFWAGMVAASSHTYRGGPVTACALAGALAGTGWSVQALIFSAWSRLSWEILGAAVASFWVFYAVARARQQSWQDNWDKREAERRARLDRELWPRILSEAGFRGITVAGSPTEPQKDLVVVWLKLPANGSITFARLDAARENIEVAAGLRDGAVSFFKNLDDSSLVKLQVSYVDRLKGVYPFPGDTSNLSINNPFPVGVREDGREMFIRLREVAAFVVGLRGMGKSNFINVLVAQLARMPDVLIFMYDGKGGRTGVPWIRPWLDKKCDRPVIDWLAVDRAEAERMLNACLRLRDSRSRKGAGHTVKVHPHPRTPAVVLIVEEMALIFGTTHTPSYDEIQAGATSNYRLANLATQIVELGRSEAIDPVLVTRRATVENFSNSMLKNQVELRIGIGVTDPGDAVNALGANIAAKILARMRWPGAGVIRVGDNAKVAPYKNWLFEEPERIYTHAGACGDRRPAPDPDAADALGDDYARRWSRFPADILESLGVTLPDKQVKKLALAQLDTESEFDRITAQEFGEQQRVHPAKPVLLEYLHTRGVRGGTPHEMFTYLKSRGLKVDKTTIHDWLNLWIAAGQVVKPDPKLPRYVLPVFAPRKDVA